MQPKHAPRPQWACFTFTAFNLLGTNYPAYRLFMLAVAVAMFVFLLIVLRSTRVGLIIQAALTHPQTVATLGHNVPLIFMIVFGVGTGLAGLADAIGGPALVTEPSMAATLGPILFVIIIFGGMGSLAGAFIGSLVIGLVHYRRPRADDRRAAGPRAFRHSCARHRYPPRRAEVDDRT
jgi:branched-chain amino acid transport system permease protein